MTNNYPFSFCKFKGSEKGSENIPGYFVVSTAPSNLEDAPNQKIEIDYLQQLTYKEGLEDIVNNIFQKLKNNKEKEVELVIAIHGYNTTVSGEAKRYHNILRFANQKMPSSNSVFLGYRWPSESFFGNWINNAFDALRAMPLMLSIVFIIGLFLISIGYIYNFSLLGLILITITFSIPIIFFLIRILVYFRDSYRATNFAIPDLVELIRQIDHKLSTKDEYKEKFTKDDKPIRLTFLCHSMGAFVTTGAVRILTDVFDEDSINIPEEDISQKLPKSNIGNVFRLGRLILVAPDIPQITTISNRANRANFLRSSLRRFEEAYLFSNEGDMVLLAASTSANYFSLPTKTRENSFRLGNLTVNRRTINRKKHDYDDYGIVNFLNLQELDSKPNSEPEDLLDYLEIGEKPLRVTTIDNEIHDNPKTKELIANLFTYFDCTDYTDFKYYSGEERSKKEKNVLTPQCFRSFADYYLLRQTWLLICTLSDVLNPKFPISINVHGGYFDGEYSRELIYRLAFGGFKDLVNSPKVQEQLKASSDPSPLSALSALSEILKQKKIRVVLSPERYFVDMKGQKLVDMKEQEQKRNQARKQVLYSNEQNSPHYDKQRQVAKI